MKLLKYLSILFLSLIAGLATAQETTVGVDPDVIAAYPEPNVRPLAIDDSLLYDRVYRTVAEPLQVFSAPGGTLLNDLGLGFNYVTLAGAMTQGEWSQIGPERWVRTSTLSEDVAISRFAGVQLPSEGLPYTMAWTLRHLRASEVPGGEASPDNPFLYRYTRISIYETVEIAGYNWYQIGDEQWVHQFDVAKVLPTARPDDILTEKWVSVDLYEQVLIAYEGDTPVFTTLVSSGLPQWSTNEGSFHVYLRYQRTLMSGAYGRPDFYYLEEVPWTMYFDGDIALHGTFWHDGFGYRQSHGCVNMSIMDANWVYNWSSDVRDVSLDDPVDLGVYVYSSGEYR